MKERALENITRNLSLKKVEHFGNLNKWGGGEDKDFDHWKRGFKQFMTDEDEDYKVMMDHFEKR